MQSLINILAYICLVFIHYFQNTTDMFIYYLYPQGLIEVYVNYYFVFERNKIKHTQIALS